MSADRQWLHDQLKANLAQTIVAHLLEKSGNKVYQYGWEFKLQNLLRGGDADMTPIFGTPKISFFPDFAVKNLCG